ncbi:DUF2125 domain-containing protein [Mycobacterium sp. KBS0706]|uniref:DUF2125 domain-containing protein n=1 Tax=Mycobacterium sp. KBS0706 TaxID=2578109 RepID=UPI00163D9EC2|nr:DUF2125 domain-containing protein [Mycobacterium sp. KBS0706]
MRRRRRIVAVPTTLVVLLAAGWTGGWYWAAGKVEAQVQAFAANPPPGVTVDPGTVSVEGFPLAFTVESQAPSLRRIDGLTWNAAGVVATAKPWTLPEVGFTIAPPQRITLPGSPALTVEVKGSGSGSARIGSDGKPNRVLLTLSQVELAGGLLQAPLPIARINGSVDRAPEEAGAGAAASLDIEGLETPDLGLGAMGRRVDMVAARLTVLGPLPKAATAPELTAWRAAGGKLRVDQLALRWGPLVIDADGTLDLDDKLQPQGTLTAKIRGYGPVIEDLQKAGVVKDRDAGFAKVGLDLMAGQPAADGTRTVTAPIAIEKGRVSFGPLQVAKLPEIRWKD